MKEGAPPEDFVGLTTDGAFAFPAVPVFETPVALSTLARFRWSKAVAAAAAGLLGPPEAFLASLLLPGSPTPEDGLTRPTFPGLLLPLGPAVTLCPVGTGLELPPPACVRSAPVAEERDAPACPGFRCAVALPPATPPVGCFAVPTCTFPVDGLGFTAGFVAPALSFPLPPLRSLPVPSVPRGFRAAGGPIVAVAAAAAAFPVSIARCWEDDLCAELFPCEADDTLFRSTLPPAVRDLAR